VIISALLYVLMLPINFPKMEVLPQILHNFTNLFGQFSTIPIFLGGGGG